MASPDASDYFPSFDQCLDGTAQLLSWQQAYLGIRDGINHEANGPIHLFLSDPKAQVVLKRFRDPFPNQTPQTKAIFDRLTSAINAPPSANGKYDIKQIKEDALWLGKTTNIDEVSALRIVVLELQRRPADHILLDSKSSEDAVLGRSYQQPALLRSVLGASQNADFGRSILDVNSTDAKARKLRLIALFLLERVYVAKIRQLACFARSAKSLNSGYTWLRELGESLDKSWDDGSGTLQVFSAEILAAIEATVSHLQNGCPWPLEREYLDPLAGIWNDTAAAGLALQFQFLLHLLQARTTLLPAKLVSGWFELMDKHSFFEVFETINPEVKDTHINVIQSLIALLSVAVLQPSVAVAAIDEFAAEATVPSTSNVHSYLKDTACIDCITSTLRDAAGISGSKQFTLAGPAMFAWVIIMQTIRSYATVSIEAREARQAQRALDQQPHDSDNESIDAPVRPRAGERRRSSFGSDSEPPATLIETIADVVQKTMPNDDPIRVFAELAVGLSSGLRAFETISRLSVDFCTPFGYEFDGQVGLEMRGLLLELLSTSLIWMPYSPEILESILDVLSGGSTGEEIQAQCEKFPGLHPISQFLEDSRCKAQIFEQSLARFPYESAPFLALGQQLAHTSSDRPDCAVSLILQRLQNRTTLTTFLIEGLADWDLAEGDEVRLASPLDVFRAQEWQNLYNEWHAHHDSGLNPPLLLDWLHRSPPPPVSPFVIPEGSIGKVLKAGAANEGKVVMWEYRHSAFAYLGFKLQRNSRAFISDKGVSPEDVNDAVSFINNLLQAVSDEQACQMLGECSDSLYDNVDVVQTVLELTESLLYRSQVMEGVSALLVTCMTFIRTTLRFLPGRIWPFLGRSGLLGINKSESRFHLVVATSEVPLGVFPFLLEMSKLFEAAVDDALSKAVQRRASAKAVTRFEATEANTLSAGITETKMGLVLAQFHALMTDIYESCRSWRFVFPGQRTEIVTTLSRVMTKSLRYAYSIDDSTDERLNLFAFIDSSAAYIADVFLASSANNSACHALAESLAEGVGSVSDTFTSKERRLLISQTNAITVLARHLVVIRHARNQEPATLEESLFKAVPLLIRIYNTHPSFRNPVILLLESLVLTAGRVDSPPSLLAHVSTDMAKQFLQVLQKLAQPFPDTKLCTNIWNFLISTVTKRQQWFSIFLLTGNTPRETFKNSLSDKSEQRGDVSMLDIALNKASNTSSASSEELEALLNFLAQAADFWPRVSTKIREHKSAVDGLAAYLREFDPSDRLQRVRTSEIYIRTQSASHIMDIMALLVNSDPEKGKGAFASTIIGNIKHLIQGEDPEHNVVSNPGYNTTLHDRLRKNFITRFTNCQLESLKRTLMSYPRLGRSFYYDLDIADEVLRYDSAWVGGRSGGFRSEMALANENMSLVEAAIKMFHSWKSLIVELTTTLPHDERLTSDVARVVLHCLRANHHNVLPANIFHRLAQARADLAFTLLQQIVIGMKHNKVTHQILYVSWEILKDVADDLGSALTGDDSEYYRTSLRILSLALQPHRQDLPADMRQSVYSDVVEKPIDIDVVLLEILRAVVAKGFRSLVSVLHDDATRIQPSDMALLLAVLRTILNIPIMEKHHSDMLNIFSDEKTPLCASTLFSWADKLLVEGDPIYGDIAISILFELSTIQPVAESIITSGCLGQLLASNLSRVFQKGLGPFDPPMRIYDIWAKGVLPLAVNLLGALGPLIAADIAAFVNQFSGQLARVSAQFNAKNSRKAHAGLITVAVAGEIHSLALLTKILELCRDAGANAGVVSANVQDIAWQRLRVVQDVEDLLSRRSSLRSLIVSRDAREESWLRSKPSPDCKNGAESRLEEKIVDLFASAVEILNSNDA